MSSFTESDLAGMELCPHGERRKYCESCDGNAQRALAREDANVPEALIEAECTRLLEQDGWRALRTDPVSDRGRGKGFGELGMADHWFGRPLPSAGPYAVEMLWCEFKAGKKQAEKHQRDWHNKERARGFKTWIANEDFPATAEGFQCHYAKSGLMRRVKWW